MQDLGPSARLQEAERSLRAGGKKTRRRAGPGTEAGPGAGPGAGL